MKGGAGFNLNLGWIVCLFRDHEWDRLEPTMWQKQLGATGRLICRRCGKQEIRGVFQGKYGTMPEIWR